MLNPHDIYSYREGVTREDARASVMLVALGGFVDAGHTQRLLAAHILAHHEHKLVATFDVDQLVDFRGRRPMLVFEHDRYTSYDAPAIELYRVIDRAGIPFLMLTGVEPDYQWERVVAAVGQIIDELGVGLTVTAHGIPMGVPHTRPIGVTAHSTNPALVAGEASPFARVMVPGSLEGLLELRLGESGKTVVGYAVHVPQYLAAIAMPGASLTALDRIAAATGLRLERSELERAREQADEQLRSELAGREDVAQIVTALEEQYDAHAGGVERRGLPAADADPSGGEQELVADGEPLPSADEIGAEAEAFLRELGD